MLYLFIIILMRIILYKKQNAVKQTDAYSQNCTQLDYFITDKNLNI